MSTCSKDVLEAIPHRPPFLFVNKILHLDDSEIVCELHIKEDAFFFEGHYPDKPIMPGVLMCEAVFQTAGIFLSKMLQSKFPEMGAKVPVLTRLREAKFKRMAFPGDTLRLEAKFQQMLKNFFFFKGRAIKGEQTLVTLEFVLGMVDEGEV